MAIFVAHFTIGDRSSSLLRASHLGCPSRHLAPATFVAHFTMGDPSPSSLTLPCRAGHLGHPFRHSGPATTWDPSPLSPISPFGAGHLCRSLYHVGPANLVAHLAICITTFSPSVFFSLSCFLNECNLYTIRSCGSSTLLLYVRLKAEHGSGSLCSSCCRLDTSGSGYWPELLCNKFRQPS